MGNTGANMSTRGVNSSNGRSRRMRPYAGTTSLSNNHAHRDWLIARANRVLNNKRKNTINYWTLCNEMNNRFGTGYSIYQVAAALGRAGILNGQSASSRWPW